MKTAKLLFCLLALGTFSIAHAATPCNLGTASTASVFTNDSTTQCSFGVLHGKAATTEPNTSLISFPITESGKYICSFSNLGTTLRLYQGVTATISAANGAILGIQKLTVKPLTFNVKAKDGAGDIQVQLIDATSYTPHSIGVTCFKTTTP